MKRREFLTMLSAAFLTAGVFGSEISSKKGGKMLVVYYSWSGNTKKVAEFIAKHTGADVLELVPQTPYPSQYSKTVEIARKEVNAKFKAPLKTPIPDLSKYDTIFVGSPNWWGTISSPIRTFLSDAELAGKSIAPFMTHEGSRMGRAVEDIKSICPKSKVLEPLAVRGGAVGGSEKTVAAWVGKIFADSSK